MDAIEMIKGRRSVRKFKDEKVSRDLVQSAVELAQYSPSWMNTQISRFTVIDDPQQKEKFAKMAFGAVEQNINKVINAAGVMIMSYVKDKSGFGPDGTMFTSKGETWAMYDSGIAGQTLSLALFEKGIGSVILGVFDDAKAEAFLNTPEDEIVAAIIPYGIPEKESKMPPRKSINEVLRFL